MPFMFKEFNVVEKEHNDSKGQMSPLLGIYFRVILVSGLLTFLKVKNAIIRLSSVGIY